MLGGAVDVGGRGVDDEHTARGGGVHVDVVQSDAGTGDDLEFGRGGDDLGVHRGGGTHQQGIGIGDGGQQFRTVGAVYPADLDLVAEGGNGRLGKLVGYQHYGKTHGVTA